MGEKTAVTLNMRRGCKIRSKCIKATAETGIQRNCVIGKTSRKQSMDVHTENVQTDRLQKQPQTELLQPGRNLESTTVERDYADYKMQITLEYHMET